MADLARERPCIHVCVIGGAEADLYRWVEIGAEEEGLPTRSVEAADRDVVAGAYAAAQSSRFDIGVAVAPDRVVLHEAHMPPAQPVLSFELMAEPRRTCRLMGGNAARMVVRLPLRFWEEAEVTPEPGSPPRATPRGGRADANRVRGHAEIEALARAIAGKHAVWAAQPEPDRPSTSGWGDIEVRRIAEVVARILRERGLQ